MLLNTLLVIYGCLMTMDVIFMTTMHFLHDRKGYYKIAAGIWVGMILGFLADGALASTGWGVNHLFGIAFLNLTTHEMANLVSKIYRRAIPKRGFVLLSSGTWILGVLMHFVLKQVSRWSRSSFA